MIENPFYNELKKLFGDDLIYFDKVESTNNIAKDLLKSDTMHGKLIVAEQQSGGRGSHGRSFVSPSGGIYMSVIIKNPPLPPSLLTTYSAVCVCRALEKLFDCDCKIKWVNDIFVSGKKVCGILTEGIYSGSKLESAIIGIGINLSPQPDAFSGELSSIAGSILTTLATPIQKTALIKAVYDNILSSISDISEKSFLAEYENRLFIIGKNIEYIENNITHIAKVIGIDDEARLIVSDGTTEKHLLSGDVLLKFV